MLVAAMPALHPQGNTPTRTFNFRFRQKPRYSFLTEKAGLSQQTDDAQVRRMLRDARKITS